MKPPKDCICFPIRGGMYNIGMSSYQQATYIYECPNCHSEITYAAQCVVAEKQKKLKKKIISEHD